MTYWSSTALISFGVGSLSELSSPAASSVSSRMISIHRSTHSSQMNTEGPAISLRTSCWLFPQKEQYNSLPLSASLDLLSLIGRPLLSPDSPCYFSGQDASRPKAGFSSIREPDRKSVV